ncbi:MAG: hypothetical protein K1Y01_13785, partial [Vicinamibacteria bacterium]|nr:hypothetical protein [Vicinamibacteria bacterium]
MPSPSVALLAALITGRGRPRRLLVPENAPPFILNIGLVLGATTATISPQDIDDALRAVLRTEGLSPEQVWAVATHRDGKLSPTDWLARCSAHGVPTIELCLGSLFALAQWSPFPATFTIVDLDAEEAFAGARLAALLTGDAALGARVSELCLPAPGARDYIFDASPRGLAYDETVLAKLVDQLIALDGERAPATRSFEWTSRIDEAAREAARQAVASSSERDSLALEDSRKKIDELQRTIDNWERLFEESEAEAAKDAEILSRARADQLRFKTEFEEVLAAARAEKEALNQRLLRAERERDLAVQDAGRRDQAERGLLVELKERVAQFEKAAAEAVDREAAQAASWKAARLELEGRVAKVEGAAAAAEKARDEAHKEKARLEQAFTAMRAEKDALAAKLASLDAELGDALKDAARETAAQRAALDEEGQRANRLEKDIATLTAREATRLREWSEARAALSSRASAAESERDALIAKVAVFERDRDRTAADAARLQEAGRAEIAELRKRADAFEAEVAALRKREEGLAAELKASRADLSEEARRVQAEAARSRQAEAAQQARSAANEQALARTRAEVEAALEKVAEAEKEREVLRRALSEQQQRGDRHEKEAAALSAKVAGQAGELTRIEAERAKAEAARTEARTQMEAVEAARASLHSEKEALGRKLAETEKDRDQWRGAAQEQKTAAASSADLEARSRAWDVERTSMLEKIAALEAAAAQAETAHAAQLAGAAAEAARAMSASRNEGEVVAQALLVAEKDRDEQRRRADRLERDVAAHVERLAKAGREWELAREGLSEKI